MVHKSAAFRAKVSAAATRADPFLRGGVAVCIALVVAALYEYRKDQTDGFASIAASVQQRASCDGKTAEPTSKEWAWLGGAALAGAALAIVGMNLMQASSQEPHERTWKYID